MDKKEEKNHHVITVIGKDAKGIVAQVSNLLWENQINIEEIKQGIIKGNFFMIMVVDLQEGQVNFSKLSKELKKLGNKLNLDINIYNQEMFTTMNEI